MGCPHCGNWVYLGSNGWEAAGLFEHAIDAPSMMQLSRCGEYSERNFNVSGRVWLSYAEGFWDEWWLEFEDGGHQWLEEDDGVYRLHNQLDAQVRVESVQVASVAGVVTIDAVSWLVTERVDAQVAGVQGSLPVAIVPGESVVCIDAMGKVIKISIESGGNDVQISQSRVIRGAGIGFASIARYAFVSQPGWRRGIGCC